MSGCALPINERVAVAETTEPSGIPLSTVSLKLREEMGVETETRLWVLVHRDSVQ